MIGIGDLRQWLRTIGDAARARLPADLLGGDAEPDDKRLDGYLLRAAVLGAAARWTRERMLPDIEAGYRARGDDTLADMTREAMAVREAAQGLPVPGLGAAIDMALTLGALALAVAVMMRLSGVRPVRWRPVAAGALSVYLVFALWGLVLAWLALKSGGWRLPTPESVGWGTLAAQFALALLAVVGAVMPALAMGRVARVVAPRLRRPFVAGALAWAAVFAGSASFTASGAEQWLVRFFAVPAP